MAELIISEQEWLEAERFFNDEANKNAVKMSRKKNAQVQHSFIKVNGIVYGMAVHDYLGFGGLGKVKDLQTRDGKWVNDEELIVKIEARGLRDTHQDDYLIMESIDYVKGQAALIKDNASKLMKLSPENTIVSAQRLFTVIKKRKGRELFDVLRDHLAGKSILPLALRLKIAIEICGKLRKLHEAGIIHRDIKPDNIMVDLKDNKVEVNFIDFDFSILIDEEEAFVITKNCQGSLDYIAPEAFYRKEYSPESDIFALGKTFIYLIPECDLDSLIDPDPQNRILLNKLIEDLEALLKEVQGELNADAALKVIPQFELFKPGFEEIEFEDLGELPVELAFNNATKTTEPEVLSPIHNSPAKPKFMTPFFDKQRAHAGAKAAKRNLSFSEDNRGEDENLDCLSPKKKINKNE